MDHIKVTALLAAMADPDRLEMLRLLTGADGARASDLADHVQIAPLACRQQLAKLQAAGLVAQRGEFYRCESPEVRTVLAALALAA